ncbi:SCP2 sterol-binding domain-containing protein [Thiofaba sp. EF100]|uniref:ubiquinone biosynthesis accessory factor UbiJ n=1 Tax=Thiofaba sp. EF100 TaxID=3121274 RepID=UPI00322203FD
MTPEIAELARLVLERACNAALEADPATREELRGLAGRRIRIELKGLFDLDLLPQSDALIVAGPGPDAPDAVLRASPFGFLRARMRGDLMHGDIELTGDPHLAVRTARLLGGLAPDLEVALTPHVGMLLAHQLGRVWRGVNDELHRFTEHRLQDTADDLRDETGLAPHRAELEPWFDAVDRMREGVDALEARLRRLEEGFERSRMETSA